MISCIANDELTSCNGATLVIHDVAQALGAGYAYSDGAGQIAEIVKLTRVALLAPVLAIVAIVLPGETGQSRVPKLPWFVGGFFGMAAVNSLGMIPAPVARLSAGAATACLAAAVTATAIRSLLPKLLETGVRPILVIGVATLVAFALPLAAALLVAA